MRARENGRLKARGRKKVIKNADEEGGGGKGKIICPCRLTTLRDRNENNTLILFGIVYSEKSLRRRTITEIRRAWCV